MLRSQEFTRAGYLGKCSSQTADSDGLSIACLGFLPQQTMQRRGGFFDLPSDFFTRFCALVGRQ